MKYNKGSWKNYFVILNSEVFGDSREIFLTFFFFE